MAHLKKNADGHLAKVASNHHLAHCSTCDKTCWVRWEYDYCCHRIPAIGEEHACPALFVVEVICTDAKPDYADGWVFLGRIHGRCIYRYDQQLPDCCSVAGDCPDPPSEPDIELPNTDECCCVVCVYEWQATYTVSGASWTGPTRISATCVDTGMVGTVDQWILYSANAEQCIYRYRVIGLCCDLDEECSAWPADPSLPDSAADCVSCLNYQPCRIRITLSGSHAECVGPTHRDPPSAKPTGSGDSTWVLTYQSFLDGSPSVMPGTSAPFSVNRYSDGSCTTLVDTVTAGPGEFDFPGPGGGYISLAGIAAGNTVDFVFLFFAPQIVGVSPDVAIYADTRPGTVINYIEGCCGWPKMIQVANKGTAGGIVGGIFTIELLDCPSSCADVITAIFSGFAGGDCVDCDAANDSIDLFQSPERTCFFAATPTPSVGVGITVDQDPTTGLHYWRLIYDTTCGTYEWRAPFDDELGDDQCPPTGGWALQASSIIPSACGTPTVTLSY